MTVLAEGYLSVRRDWPLRRGLPVYTSDGVRVGAVREVDPDAFQVTAPLRRFCWLSRAQVVFADDDHALLLFQHHQLASHRLPGRHGEAWLRRLFGGSSGSAVPETR